MQEQVGIPSIKYHTKIDAWIVILVGAIFVFVFGFNLLMILILRTVSLATLLGPAIALGVLVLFACLSVPLYYEIASTNLVVRCGILRWTIPLASIQRVFPTRNPINGPALSLDRLQVDYVKDGVTRFILISPKDKLGFLSDLAQRGVDLNKLESHSSSEGGK